jgi:phage shock protein PspC (stress-responsive transcriptional regulator)
VIFVVFATIELASSHIGAVVIAYIVMMFVVPLAATPEER